MLTIIRFAYREGSYGETSCEPKTALLLSGYLTDDVYNIATHLKWIENPNDFLGSGNMTQYYKEDGVVTFTPEWEVDDDACIAKGNFFQIRADLLAKLLREWDAVLKTKPQFITIITDDDFVSVTGTGIRSEE